MHWCFELALVWQSISEKWRRPKPRDFPQQRTETISSSSTQTLWPPPSGPPAWVPNLRLISWGMRRTSKFDPRQFLGRGFTGRERVALNELLCPTTSLVFVCVCVRMCVHVCVCVYVCVCMCVSFACPCVSNRIAQEAPVNASLLDK